MKQLPEDFLTAGRVSLGHQAASKKRALEELAKLLAGAEEPSAERVFEALLERERLGSTGMAKGVALPHARMAGVERARGALLRLEQGVDFDALDGQPVDILVAMLVPEQATQEHLDILAALSRGLADGEVCKGLRASNDAAGALALLTASEDATA